MTTERTDPITTSDCLVSGGQSGQGRETDANAGARARIAHTDTRQSDPPPEATAEPQSGSVPGADEAADEAPPASFKDAVGASLRSMEPAAKQWVGVLRPPLFWTEGLPAAGDSWLYAKKGPWCRSDSPIRLAATAWQVATMPVRAVAFYLHWLTERPSRFLVFLTVYALLASTSYGAWLPWIW